MITSTATDELKLCNRCGAVLPVTEFRFVSRNTGKRHSNCRRCHREDMRKRRAAKRHKKLDSMVQNVNHTMTRYGHDLDRVAIIINAGISAAGGLTNFCADLIDYVRALRQDRPTSAQALRCMIFISNLITVHSNESDARRETDLAAMSDDDLEHHFSESMKNLLRSEPELVLTAADELGCTVIWPADDSVST